MRMATQIHELERRARLLENRCKDLENDLYECQVNLEFAQDQVDEYKNIIKWMEQNSNTGLCDYTIT
jgi:chromosome segregation ATPase